MKKDHLSFLQAQTWSGRSWLFMLCFLLLIVVVLYVFSHNAHSGKQYVQLDKYQLQSINKVLNSDTSGSDSTHAKTDRSLRDAYLFNFLQSEMHRQLDREDLNHTMRLFAQMNNAALSDFITTKKFLVNSPFWLMGTMAYLEALFWSLMGVLVSLIYYVSIANSRSLQTAGNEDSGSFDPAEISGQVAKMFYAPACTIVLVLGYQYLSDSNNMIDISVSNGLIVFSFIAGFFSGRVMRFIDRLKELILPFGTNTQPIVVSPAQLFSDVTVSLDLSDAVAASVDGASITEAGFNAAIVTLTAKDGSVTELVNPPDDQADTFSVKQLPYGLYQLKAALSFKKEDETIINLSNSKEVELNDPQSTFTLQLNQVTEEG